MLPKKILITGSSGFIGSHLVPALSKEGFIVHGLSRKGDMIPGAETVHKGDLLDRRSIQEACDGMDMVIHLAAITAHDLLVGRPASTIETNLIGALHVFQACKEAGVKKVIFASTGKVYGKPVSLPYDESHPTEPGNLLGWFKLTTEGMLPFILGKDGNDSVTLRIFNTYGPGQRSQFLVPTIIGQLDENLLSLGDITVKKDYIYIDDLISAIVLVAKKDVKGHHIYNVGSGDSHSVGDILDIIRKLTSLELKVETKPDRLRPEEQYEERAGISKLAGLGWHPTISLGEGLKRTLEASR